MWGKILDFDNPLIGADNTWVLMAITFGWVAFSIYAEQKWKIAAKMSGAIVALIGALVLTNLAIIPTSAPFFDDIVWGYVVPMAIPLLLLQCDLKKIGKESGRLLIIFLIGSGGTVAGSLLGTLLIGKYISHIPGIAGMMTGSYIGGGVNFAALAGAFDIPGELVSATTVADNLLMALYFFVLVMIPGLAFFRKHYKHPHVDAVESHQVSDEQKTLAASYWGKKEISLKDIAINMAISGIIVAVSKIIADFLAKAIPTTNAVLQVLNGMLGNQYLIITTLAMLLATFGSKHVAKLDGSQEIGTWLIYLFFFVIGVPASIMQVVMNAPIILVFCAIMVVVNMTICFLFGKIFKFNLEDVILASNANIGGPTTAAAMAISKGWVDLVGAIMLVGTLGYVIGTYLGLFVGNLLG